MSKFNATLFFPGQHLKYTAVNNIIEAIAALEKNRSEAATAESYSALCEEMNASSKTSIKFILGRSIYVRTENVPDVWIYRIEDTPVSYTYTTDEAFITALRAGNLQVGYFLLATLETEKPNLSIYQEKSKIVFDEVTSENAEFTINLENKNKEKHFALAQSGEMTMRLNSEVLADPEFIEGLIFKTNKTEDFSISFEYTINPFDVKFLGTDTSEGVFYPQKGVEYDITFYSDGLSLKALVSGVSY